MTPEEHTLLQGCWQGWFTHDHKLDTIAAGIVTLGAAVGALKPIDVDQLAADLVAHLPADADAQAIASTVVQKLAAQLGK